VIRLKPFPTSDTVRWRREPQSQHGANPDDSFGPLTGPSILTSHMILPCSGLCKVTERDDEILNSATAHARVPLASID
jgi:hypothetical protein